VRSHGLRHAAVTAALDVTGGSVRAVAKFSSHRWPFLPLEVTARLTGRAVTQFYIGRTDVSVSVGSDYADLLCFVVHDEDCCPEAK
jgi:hypothetical protein